MPADPVRFVTEAERVTNAGDVEGAVGVYANDALLETISDGAAESHRGLEAIRGAWSVYMSVLQARGFELRKRLLVAAGSVIVNDWEGSFQGRNVARGIECWHFDDRGRVVEHRLYSYFDVRPSASIVQRTRLLAMYPRLAFAFLRGRRRTRAVRTRD